MAAGLHPQRHGRIETGRSGRVGVHVGGNEQPRFPRRLDHLEYGGQLVPVVASRGFEVIDLGRGAGHAGNLDQFLHTFLETAAL